jgi:hypothetical protein
MLFIALLFILFIIYVVHVSKEQLIEYLEKGDIDNALRLLRTFDKMAKDD